MNVCVSEMLKVLSVILIKDVGSYRGGWGWSTTVQRAISQTSNEQWSQLLIFKHQPASQPFRQWFCSVNEKLIKERRYQA